MTMEPRIILTAIFLITLLPALFAQSGDIAAALERMPKPWKTKANRFTFEEYDATLHYWQKKHSKLFALSERARSGDGYPVYLIDLTDQTVADDDKQRVLITGLHAGPERTGTTTILRLIEWLLSDDAEAREILRKQRILLMPIMNPHGFFPSETHGNAAGLPIYDGRRGLMFDIPTMKLRDPEKSPELSAFLEIVDEFQPEVHADIHGVSLHYNGQLVVESVGSAGSNHALRPWDARVSNAMIAAAIEEGFPSDRWEADAQRMLWGPNLNSHADKLWMGRVFFYPGMYPYMKYHTLPVLTENGWEQGGVARLKGLLRLGNTTPSLQPHRGYSVDRMKTIAGHYLAAYGTNAAERRRSRAELWQRQGNLSLGVLYSETDHRIMIACGITPKGRAAMVPKALTLVKIPKVQFAKNLAAFPSFNSEALAKYMNAGPEQSLYVAKSPALDAGIQHGLAMTIRISYAAPELLDVRLNGHSLPQSTTDGYQTWLGDGYTHLRVNIPPEKTAIADLFVLSCIYTSDQPRTYGWRPPAEVVEALNKKTKP
jgi:hypothetical protein